MLTTPHALVGATLVLLIPNKGLALLLAFSSHFLFDAFLPHWNPSIYREIRQQKKLSPKTLSFIIFDALLGVMLTVGLTYWYAWPDQQLSAAIIIGSLLAILPDFIEVPFYFFHYQSKLMLNYVRFCHRFQARAEKLIGLLTQLAVIFVCFCLLLMFR
jgi:hypothetical protein